MMYNPQLETFICVVDSGSFSKAAEKLYITSPAVIKQINSLESSLDLQLFERTHRGLLVTEAGKSLYQDAKYLVQYSKDSVSRAKEAMNARKETIRIGVSPMTPQVFDFYNLEVFNRCENSNDVLLAIKNWESVHPLMKIIPVEWDYSIPFGLLYSKEPSKKVRICSLLPGERLRRNNLY